MGTDRQRRVRRSFEQVNGRILTKRHQNLNLNHGGWGEREREISQKNFEMLIKNCVRFQQKSTTTQYQRMEKENEKVEQKFYEL